jgi:hypothetical protein
MPQTGVSFRKTEIGTRRPRSVGSRFLPGARLPLYVIAGVLKVLAVVFAFWTLVATLLWTPTIVLLTANLSEPFISRLFRVGGIGWAPGLLAREASCCSCAQVEPSAARHYPDEHRCGRLEGFCQARLTAEVGPPTSRRLHRDLTNCT